MCVCVCLCVYVCLAWVRVMVRHDPQGRWLESWFGWVRVMVRHDPLGRRLESWFGLGWSHGQTRPTGQAVRVLVWLGLADPNGGGIRVWDPPESLCSILGPKDHW